MGRACGRLLSRTAGPAGTCPWAQGGLVGVCGGAGHQGLSSSWRISVPLGPIQALLSFLTQCLPCSAFSPISPALSPYTASGPWALQGDPPVSTSV